MGKLKDSFNELQRISKSIDDLAENFRDSLESMLEKQKDLITKLQSIEERLLPVEEHARCWLEQEKTKKKEAELCETLNSASISPQLENEGIPALAQQWQQYINEIFAQDASQKVVEKRLREALRAERSIKYYIDIYNEPSPAEGIAPVRFIENGLGSCLLISISEGEEDDRYAAYPFPNGGSAWFYNGAALLSQLFENRGIQESLAPQIIIERPGLVVCTGEKTGETGVGLKTFELYQKGVFRAIEP